MGCVRIDGRIVLAALVCAVLAAGCDDGSPAAAQHPLPCAAADSYGCLQSSPGAPIGETLAVNTHYGPQVDHAALAQLHAAGVHILRNDLTWANIERSPGEYDFESSGYDDLVEAAESEGLHLLFILDYGNPLYGPERAVVSDSGRAAFAAFAEAAARRYGGRGHSWEIWNEPNGPQFWNGPGIAPDTAEYAQLVETTVPSLRRADPSGKILIGGVFYGLAAAIEALGGVGGPTFVQELADSGVLALADGVTVHFYRSAAPETVATDVEQIRAVFAQAGADVELWSGEWGYSTYDPTVPPTGLNFLLAVDPDRQASYVARMMLTDDLLDIPASVYYQDRDPPDPSPGDIEGHWGLVHADLTPKPAYDALFTLNRLVGSAPRLGTLSLAAGEHGVVFDGGQGRVTALWTESEASWTIHPTADEVHIVGRDGDDVTPEGAPDGSLSVSLQSEGGPIYIAGDFDIESGK